MAIVTLLAIETDMAIVTLLAIETDMAIVTILVIETKEPSDFQSKRMGVPAGDLDGLLNPLALTSSIEWLLISVYSESLEAKSRENMSAKLAYSTGTFLGASSTIKPAIWGLREG